MIQKTPQDLLKMFVQLQGNDEQEQKKPLRYVIYARKSTDGDEKQARSLPDQVAECKDLAKEQGLKVISEPIMEAKSAKEPNKRLKFRQMITDIEKGRYDGIIAWHPDRLARNMREAGEIIDLIDNGKIKDLKFRSFHFDNSSSGKMLLGIAFVMSKQYSDQLSENIKRGNKRGTEEVGKCFKPKLGYFRDSQQYLRPDGENYDLVKAGWKMRLEGKTQQEIADYLNENGLTQTVGFGTEKRISVNVDFRKVSEVLMDSVYAGVLKHGKSFVDLTQKYDFKPMVAVNEFLEINKNDKNIGRLKSGLKKAIRSDLLRGMVYCSHCKQLLSTGITRKNDGKSYFFYRCRTEDCEFHNKSVRARVVVDFVAEFLENHKFITKTAYKRYVSDMEKAIAKNQADLTEKKRILRQKKSGLATKINNTKTLLHNEMAEVKPDVDLQSMYKDDLKLYQKLLTEAEEQLSKIEEMLRNSKSAVLDYDKFVELFENLASIVKKPQSMKDLDFIIKKIFSNFTVSKSEVVDFELNSPFKELVDKRLFVIGGAGGSRTRVQK
ncbi:MAG: Recombinase [candidate division CPR2 bacterium GW2011_GWC1_41_48]|uniref:Recombinase n=1 Tax=candidate division CPR2 bacterium GW2011_GWC1_41_48 TaxID=1618344 RepID=A0A0G0W6W3_UNCC2|nr:MAG: Recombinase [candidate division CPR2 bacterium GW2011_GWC2_39_35]KKR27748.1 MAG: Recombinase [candidate division CPR2 bacterium GW2011_GWD1_39_7]KKR28498.1 MAG: Recombinase [candidate division CPR2 bacterium GW2011_GWD2_39_7]KKS08709.1 MAG: Recombinase [candidate division CPR2 bacterium GW2011_GWC1_41_48]